jgi:hypothetical protein
LILTFYKSKKNLRPKYDLSSPEAISKQSTCDSPKQLRSEETKKKQLRFVARLALAFVKRRRKFCTYNRCNAATVFFPERLVAS